MPLPFQPGIALTREEFQRKKAMSACRTEKSESSSEEGDVGLAAVCRLLELFAWRGGEGERSPECERVFDMAMKLAAAKRLEIAARAHRLLREEYDAET